MGAPTDMLVLVSMMYDNPKGFAKEEFVEKFGKLKLNRNLSDISSNLGFGLYGFANLFNLDYNKQYLENREKYWNEKYKYDSQREIISNYGARYLEVIHKEHESLGETLMHYKTFDTSEFPEVSSFRGFKKGDYVHKSYFSDIVVPEEYDSVENSFLVRDVMHTRINESGDSVPEINQLLKVEAVKVNSELFSFRNFEDFWRNYPEYHPENMYDFNQESGFLYPNSDRRYPSFRWLKKGDKYLLDFEHFSNIIGANSNFGSEESWKHKKLNGKSRYSLTDVVLTSEAIRRRNWKILGYNALWDYNKNFVYKNERTYRKYEQAIFDTENSVKAQNEGLNNFEFLREHHFNSLSRNFVSQEEVEKMLKEENKQNGINKRKATAKWKRENKNDDGLDLPF